MVALRDALSEIADCKSLTATPTQFYQHLQRLACKALDAHAAREGVGLSSATQVRKDKNPPDEWDRKEYRIKETWRVYDPSDNHVVCYLSPLYGVELQASQAIEAASEGYVGDWGFSAELTRW